MAGIIAPDVVAGGVKFLAVANLADALLTVHMQFPTDCHPFKLVKLNEGWINLYIKSCWLPYNPPDKSQMGLNQHIQFSKRIDASGSRPKMILMRCGFPRFYIEQYLKIPHLKLKRDFVKYLYIYKK